MGNLGCRSLVLLAILCSTLEAQGATSASLFIGTWRLVSIDADSATRSRLGARPTGLIMYDASRHMAVQIQPDRRRAAWPPRSPTAAEALDAATGYTAYFGTYTVDDRAGTVTHHREGALNLDVVDYVRRFEFQDGGRRLVLSPVDRPGLRLAWERVP